MFKPAGRAIFALPVYVGSESCLSLESSKLRIRRSSFFCLSAAPLSGWPLNSVGCFSSFVLFPNSEFYYCYFCSSYLLSLLPNRLPYYGLGYS